MTTKVHLQFHLFHGKDVVLSRHRTRAQRVSNISNSLCMALGGEFPGSLGTEVVFSHRPIQISETVRLRFGQPLDYKIRSKVTLGFTKHSPNTMKCVPSTSELQKLPGYWVSELPIDNGTRLHFSVNSSGEIHFNDRGRTCAGPRVKEKNISLWAVIIVPKYDIYVEFDPEPVASRGLSSSVPVSSPQRSSVQVRFSQICGVPANSSQRSGVPVNSSQRSGVPVNSSQRSGNPVNSSQRSGVPMLQYSIVTKSSQNPRTINQRSSTNQSSFRETLPREDKARGDRQTSTGPECIICYNKPPDTALSPCGHMYTCYNCALDLWQERGQGICPTCRKKISKVLRVYRD